MRRLCLLCLLCIACSLPAVADQAGGPQSEDALRKQVEELRRTVAEQERAIAALRERLAELEAAVQGKKEPTEEAPPIDVAQTEAATGTSRATSTFMPDFAVIGNHRGTFLVPRGYEARNRFQLAEFELALQQPIYTGMTFYSTLAGGADADFSIGVEEAYVTLSRPFKLPVDAVVGKRRSAFGKHNLLHPHQWRFADQPAPVAAFLGPEGMFGNGAAISITLPGSTLFANLELGLWQASSAHAHHHTEEDHEHETTDEHHHGAVGTGISNDMPVARLWLSSPIGPSGELELGASHAFGKTDDSERVRLTGLDLTYRLFPSTFSRFQFQGEMFWHRRTDRAGGTGAHTRTGHFALLTYAPDQYNEFGLRYDNTRFPYPLEGREQTFSLIYTNRLSEATLMRLQYKLGDRTTDILAPARRGFSEVYLQFIWGAGSHTHPLQ